MRLRSPDSLGDERRLAQHGDKHHQVQRRAPKPQVGVLAVRLLDTAPEDDEREDEEELQEQAERIVRPLSSRKQLGRDRLTILW